MKKIIAILFVCLIATSGFALTGNMESEKAICVWGISNDT